MLKLTNGEELFHHYDGSMTVFSCLILPKSVGKTVKYFQKFKNHNFELAVRHEALQGIDHPPSEYNTFGLTLTEARLI